MRMQCKGRVSTYRGNAVTFWTVYLRYPDRSTPRAVLARQLWGWYKASWRCVCGG